MNEPGDLPARLGPANDANARAAGVDPEDVSPDELLLLRVMVALQGRELDDDGQGLPRFPGAAERVEEIRRLLAAALGAVAGAWGRLREVLESWNVTDFLGREGVVLTARGGHLVAHHGGEPAALIIPLRGPKRDRPYLVLAGLADQPYIADTCDVCGNRHEPGEDPECDDGEPEPSVPRDENEAGGERRRTGGQR